MADLTRKSRYLVVFVGLALAALVVANCLMWLTLVSNTNATQSLVTQYHNASVAQIANTATETKRETVYVNATIARIEHDIETTDEQNRLRAQAQVLAELHAIVALEQSICLATHAKC
jgi:sensor histidine kinase YesM